MEHEGSLPHSQEFATCPYPQPDRSNLCLPVKALVDPFLYYPPIYAWVFQVFFFPTKTLYAPLLSPHMLHVLPISVFLTWLPEWHLVRSTEHETPYYAEDFNSRSYLVENFNS
jgi:hypothetical protein